MGRGPRPDVVERNRSLAQREATSRALRGRKKHYRCGPVAEPLSVRIERNSMPVPWTGCVLWLGALDSDGYGHVMIGDKRRGAHRVAYEIAKGEIPAGLHIDHLCRVRCCVNPDHLEPVTCRENLLRGQTNGSKTHCKNGHAFDAQNTVRRDGGRQCRTCRNAKALAAYHRKKGVK